MTNPKKFVVETVKTVEIRTTLLVTAESADRAEELVESTDYYPWAEPENSTGNVGSDEAADNESARTISWTRNHRRAHPGHQCQYRDPSAPDESIPCVRTQTRRAHGERLDVVLRPTLRAP